MKYRIKEVLEKTGHLSNGEYYLFLDDSNERKGPSLLEYVMAETGGKESIEASEVFESILSAMSYFMDDYSAPNIYRQKLWNRFLGWLRNIALELKIEFDEDMICQIMPRPFVGDKTIEIIKDLHYSPQGLSKAQIADKYRISERTVKELLNRLDKNVKGSELYIAGQRVGINIKHKDVCDIYNEQGSSRYRFFSAASTVNPIFLQMNIAQVHSLINGLKCSYYHEERDMSIASAVEIWSQLSDYTRNRIRLVYAQNDNELAQFLDIVEDELDSFHLHTYVSERDILSENILSDYEQNEIMNKLRYR